MEAYRTEAGSWLTAADWQAVREQHLPLLLCALCARGTIGRAASSAVAERGSGAYVAKGQIGN